MMRADRAAQKIKSPGCCHPGLAFSSTGEQLDQLHLIGLQAFLTLDGHVADALAFLQGLETTTLDGAEMNKQIRAALWGDEAKTLGIVEPFDRTILTFRHRKLQFITKLTRAQDICVETGVAGSSEVKRQT
jgi:hypothetical protein